MGYLVGWPVDFLKGMRFKLLIKKKIREKYKIKPRETVGGSFYEPVEVSFPPRADSP